MELLSYVSRELTNFITYAPVICICNHPPPPTQLQGGVGDSWADVLSLLLHLGKCRGFDIAWQCNVKHRVCGKLPWFYQLVAPVWGLQQGIAGRKVKVCDYK